MHAPRLTLALALFWTLPTSALGQAADPGVISSLPESGVRIVGSFGMGVGSDGGAGLLALALRTGAGDFIGRSAATFEFVNIFGPSEDVTDVALLFGRLHEGDSGWIRLAAGPAYVEHRRSGDPVECVLFFCAYEMHRSSTFGLALQADGALRPRRTLGLGVSAFANLNGSHPFVGGVVTLHIGRVSRRSGS
jgi:hypothetical protein